MPGANAVNSSVNVAGGAAKDAGEKMRALLEERSGRTVDDHSVEAIAQSVAANCPIELWLLLLLADAFSLARSLALFRCAAIWSRPRSIAS